MARAQETVELQHPLFDTYPPLRVWGWREGSNSVLLAQLDESVGLVWAKGEAGEGSVDVFEEGLRALLARPSTVLFWDLELLDRYAPKTRRMIVELLAAERKKLERIHLLSDKAMIAMAASAVNLVLGGILQVYRERGPWLAAVRKQLGDPSASSASGSRPSISTAGASASTGASASKSTSASSSTSSVSPASASSSGWRKKPDDDEPPPPTDSGLRWRKR